MTLLKFLILLFLINLIKYYFIQKKNFLIILKIHFNLLVNLLYKQINFIDEKFIFFYENYLYLFYK
jgi:hypothetical protein